MQDGKLI